MAPISPKTPLSLHLFKSVQPAYCMLIRFFVHSREYPPSLVVSCFFNHYEVFFTFFGVKLLRKSK
jgi:hypothetical protein